MKEKIVKHKKALVMILILIVVVVAVSLFSSRAKVHKEEMLAAMMTPETALIERRTLVESISATGTVTSIGSKSVQADVTGIKVESVPVKVGDRVEEGEIICILDATDIEEDLADARTTLNATQGKTQIEVSSAERSLSEAETGKNIDLKRADEDVVEAWNDYLLALTDLEEAEADWNEAKETTIEKKGEYEYRKGLLEEAEDKLNSTEAGENNSGQYETQFSVEVRALSEYITREQLQTQPGALDHLYISNAELQGYMADFIVSEADDEKKEVINRYLETIKGLQVSYQTSAASYAESTAKYQDAQSDYQSLQTEVTEWQNKYNTAQQNETSCETAYEQALSTVESKLDAYNQQVRSKEDTIRNDNSTVISKEESLATSRLNAATSGLTDKQQIKKYEEQIEECTVTAPMSGIITAVNVEAGDTYSGAAIVTIEDTSDYEISAEIEEYDISAVKVGQKVVIKTNGTGDLELDGTVKEIAPRATTGGTSVTYTVTISIDTPCNELKLDMTAKLSIILNSRENVLTVPYDSVQEDEEGKFYIEVMREQIEKADISEEQGDNIEEVSGTGIGQSEKIYITKGIESDYYIEVIGSGLKEGMSAIVPVSPEGGSDIMDMINRNGPMGGF